MSLLLFFTIMNPYREPAQTKQIALKKRSIFKTIYLKLLIKIKGTWKQRFIRCSDCTFSCKKTGPYLNIEFWSHRMRCVEKHVALAYGNKK